MMTYKRFCGSKAFKSAPLRAVAGVVGHAGYTGSRVVRAQCFISDTSLPYESYNLHTGIIDPAAEVKQAVNYDFVVIGSGIAGLTYALRVAEFGSVAVITKESLSEGCTVYAQGGVCAVLDPLDSVEHHIRDTIVAGNFLNDQRAVEVVCSEGPQSVLDLVAMGAQFTRTCEGSLHLTKEGGHCARRIVHAADTTGAEISRTLVDAVSKHSCIDVYEGHMCMDFCVTDVDDKPHCFGVDVLNCANGRVKRFVAYSTMLASGGAGQLYPSTTNPAVCTGDGIAAAWRAGADVTNMEFVQFHPTALYEPSAKGRTFLISEAVRGEGGRLYNFAGERFMHQYDARLELAPRDVVARAIQDQMALHGTPHVWLDISHVESESVLTHFPAIAAKCVEQGIDITQEPIPVLPAQHYLCGGVQTDLAGKTLIAGLYACGEVTHTGLHGSNRLASNSLLEGLVFGARAVEPSVAHAASVQQTCMANIAEVAEQSLVCAGSPVSWRAREWCGQLRMSVQQIMWKYAGIERSEDGLSRGLQQVASLSGEARALAGIYGPNRDVLELCNLLECAEMVLQSALSREESRGLHFRTDFPRSSDEYLHATTLKRKEQLPVAHSYGGKNAVTQSGRKVVVLV
eukprot:jgi/Ulvmu1/8256/UM041_0067.1